MHYVFIVIYAAVELQFGFKSGFSTTLCTGVLKNVISHYMFEDSPVYAYFLDASKAFDLVNHERLFAKLLNTVLALIIRIF